MKKFKKGLALSLALAMGLSLCACGDKKDATTTEAPKGGDDVTTTGEQGGDVSTDEVDAPAEHETMTPPAAEGDKIYIYSWNTELGEIITDEFLAKYPEYKDLIENVNFGVGGGSQDYITKLEAAIQAGGEQYPSIIAMDNDLAKMFMESDYVVPVSEGGITEAMYSETYHYTKAFATYDDGLRGVTWQATPGGFCYRSDIAAEVLDGAKEPDEVQPYVKDWDTFFETADKMKAKGYKMVSGSDDVKFPILDQKTSPWVQNDTLNIDQAVKDYLETAKKLYDGEYTRKSTQWDDSWYAGMEDDVFGYFGCTWFTYWSLKNEKTKADYRMCAGPVDYHWGGTYLALTKDCPNKELAGFVMYTLTCDTDFMYEHMAKKSDYVNNKAAVQKVIDEGKGAADPLGGTNPVPVWAAQCDSIDLSNATQYDATFNGYLDAASQAYNTGEAADIDAAIEVIKNKVRESYSYITVE